MHLPKFNTNVSDIDTPEAVSRVFDDFVRDITREDLFRGAEWYVKHRAPNCSVYSFRAMPGGLMRMVIGLTVMQQTDGGLVGESCDLDERLAAHYGFTQETVPPRMLVREAVALRVRYGSVMSDLERELGSQSGRVDGGVRSALENVAAGVLSPEDAYLLPDETVDAIIRGL